jgi:hypothetical protein
MAMHPLVAAACMLSAAPLGLNGGVMTLRPGTTGYREAPGAWEKTVTLSGPLSGNVVVEVPLSEHLYGQSEGGFHQPLSLTVAGDRPRTLAFLARGEAPQGSALDILLDGRFFHRLTWPAAATGDAAGRAVRIEVPSGSTTVTLRVVGFGGCVRIDRYVLADDAAALPDGLGKVAALAAMALPANATADGYRGIWFELGQRTKYGDKYSGGLGTYTAKHVPLAVYAPAVDKTFFVYGGTPAADQRRLQIMASWYDHKTHRVPRPTIVLDKYGVDDPHDNASIALDGDGHVWVFVSGRGQGRPGCIYRSTEPYSVARFALVVTQDMTYPQPWFMPGRGFFHFLTRYTRGRELYWQASADGMAWTDAQRLAGFGGHYQVSGMRGDGMLATAFNYHPGGDVDRRTNLYYLQTGDSGKTWTTADGGMIAVPLERPDNPALLVDYQAQGRLVYVKDVNFDAAGRPIILYLTSANARPGPEGDPRTWHVAHWTGKDWTTHVICGSDHNYVSAASMSSRTAGGSSPRPRWGRSPTRPAGRSPSGPASTRGALGRRRVRSPKAARPTMAMSGVRSRRVIPSSGSGRMAIRRASLPHTCISAMRPEIGSGNCRMT